MMYKIETKEDFDELMLGQEKFRKFIEVNKLRNGKNTCVTDQKILINKLIRSGIIPERSQIIDDFNKVLTRTDIFDFTNEDGSTTIKLNQWQGYIADSAIKDFNALLDNKQVYFSDDNGDSFRFAFWISRLTSNSIKNLNNILTRNDITFEKYDNGGYITFSEFKDKLADGSIKNLDFIIDKDGAIKEDNLGFKDFVKDIANLRYFAPEAFDKVDLNNPEHRNLLSIKSKEEPDKIVFGWNLFGYLSIVFTFGLAYVFGWSQKLFANAIANDLYNGSYIAKLQKRKKDNEIVVEPITIEKVENDVSLQSESEQWDSKSDGEIIQAQVKKTSKVVDTKNNVSRTKRIENTTKNSIDIINTNKKTLNGENECEQKPSNNKQKENKNIKKNGEIIKSTTKKTLNTDYSNNNDKKTNENPNSKRTKTDQSAQINKNVEQKTKKNIIYDNSKKENNQTKERNSIHKQELGKEDNTKKNQTAKNNNSEKNHVIQDEKKFTNGTQKHKQSYGVDEFLADFKDATNMNFIFLDDKDAQKQLQDRVRKLDECKTKYNEILEANKDALQKYESEREIKIVNTIDFCMKDAKLELDNRKKKPGTLLHPMETSSLNKPFLAKNGLSQNLANSNLNSPFNPCPPPHLFNYLYQGQKLATNETEMDNKRSDRSDLTKKSILNPLKPEPSQTKKSKKINYIVDEEDKII